MEVTNSSGQQLVLIQIDGHDENTFQWINIDTGYRYSTVSTADDAKEMLRTITNDQYYLTKSYNFHLKAM